MKQCKSCQRSDVKFYGREAVCSECKNKIKKFEPTKMIKKTERIISHLKGFKAYLLEKKKS